MSITYSLRIDSEEAIKRAEEKKADCYERFNSVEVVPDGIDKIKIICK